MSLNASKLKVTFTYVGTLLNSIIIVDTFYRSVGGLII